MVYFALNAVGAPKSYIYTIENSPMDLSKHPRILSNVSRGEKLREV